MNRGCYPGQRLMWAMRVLRQWISLKAELGESRRRFPEHTQQPDSGHGSTEREWRSHYHTGVFRVLLESHWLISEASERALGKEQSSIHHAPPIGLLDSVDFFELDFQTWVHEWGMETSMTTFEKGGWSDNFKKKRPMESFSYPGICWHSSYQEAQSNSL